MQVLKMCFISDFEVSDMIGRIKKEMTKEVDQIHVQHIDNTPYLRWLKNIEPMKWKIIVDMLLRDGEKDVDDVFEDVSDFFKQWPFSANSPDCYGVSQIVYGEPVNNSELITSCYRWNYYFPCSIREEKMKEHFCMEQRQIYYDYVVFQSVDKVLTKKSPKFDFFFESHVSSPEGINKIYSKPTLEEMREHSKAFLDVTTRELSFGKVFCFGGAI